MLIRLEDAIEIMLKQQAIDLRDPALIGISFDGDLAVELLKRLPVIEEGDNMSQVCDNNSLVNE